MLNEYGEFPTGGYSGTLLVVGNAKCIESDLRLVAKAQMDILCVNDIGMHFPQPIHHWYSNHGDQLDIWLQARKFRRHGFEEKVQTHSCFGIPNNAHSHLWPWPGHGSSGLNAIYTGLGLGYDNLIVVGMPLDDTGHYFDFDLDHPWGKERPSNFTKEVPDRDGEPRYWSNAKRDHFDGRVRIVSGRMSKVS